MDSREIALRVINKVSVNNAYANIALMQELNRHELSDIDRRFITELVYGTIKSGETLDWLLAQFVSRPLKKIAPVILDILRMGVYQLFFLSKVPAAAACNQAAELTKRYGHAGTVRFVNGVLRNMARSRDKITYPDRVSDPVQYLALKHCHPAWLVARWIDDFGFDGCEDLCIFDNGTAPLTVRTNTLKTTPAELLVRLQQEGAKAVPSKLVPEGIIIYEHPALSKMTSLSEGLFQVQDESSMLVAHVLEPQPGETVIDACAAPGGKSTHIAALMNNQGVVKSFDIHAHKLKLIIENARRLGITIIDTAAEDAVKLDSKYQESADRVLVDAPCSGWGVLRRKPDARWRKTSAMLDELPQLQYAILVSAAKCLRPGGVLVYSTCTMAREENEAVVERFLATNEDFYAENTGRFFTPAREAMSLQLLPQVDGIDGFFIARLKRRNR